MSAYRVFSPSLASGMTRRDVLRAIPPGIAVLLAACTGAVSREEYEALKAQLEAAKASVVQAGNLQPAPPGAQLADWDTPESLRGGLRLLATYDSSGPNAWDPIAHPVVYFTSEGKGYGHRPSATNQLPGVQVIDAYSKRVIASRLYDLGNEVVFQPHGLGVSPDGRWIYIGFSDRVAETRETRNLILVINAQTLKLHMLLSHPVKRLHHIGGFTDWMGRDRVVLDLGFGADGGPHFVLDPKDNNRVVRAITYDDIRIMGHPYTAPDPTGKFLYVSMGAPWIREAPFYAAGIAKFNLETGAVTVIEEVGNHPIGIAHTSDGKYTYVADGTNSLVFKIDNEQNAVVGKTSAGVAGPYGLRLNWDETELYVMGKGEGSHNVGGAVGVIDTKIFRPTQKFNQPINTGGAIIDHGILHPDPNVNELWISSAGTFETIVLDLNTYTVKARIPSPNGGDTHSGAFVRYNPDFTGELLIDMLGPQKAMYAMMRAKAAAVRQLP